MTSTPPPPPKCSARQAPDHLCILPRGHDTEDHFCAGGDLTWSNPTYRLKLSSPNRPRPKKDEAIAAIIDSAPPELKLEVVQWKHIANLLGRAYEGGRAMSGDTEA